MKKIHVESIYEITTKLGYKIQVTGDHPILSKSGMIKADELLNKMEIAVNPFAGID